MKLIYLFLTILILGGTPLQHKEILIPIKVPLVVVTKVTDSLKTEYLKAAKTLDNQTDLLISQKRKLEKENAVLKKEIIRLNLLVNNISIPIATPIVIKKESFLKRWFKRKKKNKKLIQVNNTENK